MITLIISSLIAAISVYIWSSNSNETNAKYHIKLPIYMFVGASLMWSVDVICEIHQFGFEYFTNTNSAELKDDFLLSLTITGFGLFVWCTSFLFKTKSDKNLTCNNNS